ncbi:hypothetical protein [Tenacibaculum mesophilum]|uniref:hypothetical protein n=1 Tax=Tenacibaculum mesophilum TaxID=104268 RepID=UPI003F60B6D6
MKKNSFYILGVLLYLCTNSYGQNINLSNSFLKQFLLTKSSDLTIGSHKPEIIDLNNDGEISITEASYITEINIYAYNQTHNIYNLTDLPNFPNLEVLIISKGTNGPVGTLTSLDLSQNLKLKKLSLGDLSLQNLNITQNSLLSDLILTSNNLSSINITNNRKLERLIIRYNPTSLNTIDLSYNTELRTLILDDSGIDSIDVTKNGLLNMLFINRSPITELNILNNCNLKRLTCTNTNITTIDARNCKLETITLGNKGLGPVTSSSLKKVYLTGQPLKELYGENYGIEFFNCANLDFICVDSPYMDLITKQMNDDPSLNYVGPWGNNPNCTITTACDIPEVAGNCNTPTCPIINFPDPNFKQALLNISPAIDTDGDGEICIDEAEIVTYLPLDGKNINDVTGIEYFINIEVLKLNDNNIVSSDLSNNLKIRNLSVFNNNLTNLNVTNNEALVSLYASNNKLTSIDISTNKSLKVLHLYDNNISQLDASNLTQLTFIGIDNNSLTSLNITNCYTLEAIQARNNQLSQLDISTNSNLGVLQVPNNKLTGLNITSNNSKLKQLLINQNLINKIDIRNCNSMSRLDIRNNPNLKEAFLTGSHSFYSSFDNFGDLTRDNYISINNCPKLNFVCVNNVSFFNDIKNYITGMYPLCTVNTDCTLPRNDFSSYFILSPNPTTGSMILSKKDTGTTASTADIFNAQTGSFVKSVNLLFGGGFGNLSFKKTTTSTTTQRLGNPINLEDGAPINVTDLATGSYIFRVNSNRGTHTTNFIKM